MTLLLTSHLALPKGPAADKLQPLSPSEWNQLAAQLKSLELRPGVLLSWDRSAVQTQLGLDRDDAERISQLLSRGAQLAIEMERLGSLGIWVLTRADAAYPALLKKRLGAVAPPVLFGAGEQGLLSRGFLAVVGSRDVDEAGAAFAQQVGEGCARGGLVVVSGGAKGVDRLSMAGALKAGGAAVGVLADSLERVIREPEYRAALVEGRLTLVSAVHPGARFSVASAMGRNKLIYCLADYGLVVAASLEKGGTRAGALEVLKHRWVPLFVRSGEGAPAGNQDLIKRGGLPLGPELPVDGLAGWMEFHSAAWTEMAATATRPTLLEAGRLKRAGETTTAAPAVVAGDDLFLVVWPHIAQRLPKWPTTAELAHHLKVEPTQLQAWLERALKEGLIRYEVTTGRYSLLPTSLSAGQAQFDL